MIRHKTVFVLGAGASMPYQLPSGHQLRRDICQIAVNPDGYGAGRLLLKFGGLEPAVLHDFGQAFSRSNIQSIDTFLSKRPAYADVGKLAIAAVLCGYERPPLLFSDELDDHWLRLLWNALIRDTSKAEEVVHSAVRFITFNYDRSLEHFLFESIKHSWGLSDWDCATLLKQIPILHLYGELGAYAAVASEGMRCYGDAIDSSEKLKLAASGIRIIPEQRGNNEFSLARNWFDWAERICFLGFGFDALNIDRLNLGSVLSHKRPGGVMPALYATTLGRTAH